MKRITEPELMDSALQAKAYAEADFESAHSQIISHFTTLFPGIMIHGDILDLGCGPGDITFRFARLFNKATITGIDGASSMLKLARARAKREQFAKNRVNFIQAMIPSNDIPQKPYELIVSNSLLHHLHNPQVLWETILQQSTPNTIIFIADLCRPESREEALQLVDELASDEPKLLKNDFYHSLLAAFCPSEITSQLAKSGLAHLTINQIGHHLIIYGKRT